MDQKQGEPCCIGIIQNTRELSINGGTFTQHNHSTGCTANRESSTDENIKKLYDRISKAAAPRSRLRGRAQAVSAEELKKIVDEMSQRLTTLSKTFWASAGSSPFHRLSMDDVLYDILKWLYDPVTQYSIAWMHSNDPTQALLLATAVVHILRRHGLLSACYSFSDTTVDHASVVPNIAYQLSQNIPQAKDQIAQAVASEQDLDVFTTGCYDQVTKLIVKPLTNASKLCKGFVEAPKLIIILGSEDFKPEGNGDFNQTAFLDSLSGAVESLESTSFRQKLLVLGRYTDQLQSSFSSLQLHSRSRVIQRPIQIHDWLGKERKLCQREEELAKMERSTNAKVEDLRKGLRSREDRLWQMEKEATRHAAECEHALRCREEELANQEQELKRRWEEMEEFTRKRKEELKLQDAKVKQMEEQMKIRTLAAAEREKALRLWEGKLVKKERAFQSSKKEKNAKRQEDALKSLKSLGFQL